MAMVERCLKCGRYASIFRGPVVKRSCGVSRRAVYLSEHLRDVDDLDLIHRCPGSSMWLREEEVYVEEV